MSPAGPAPALIRRRRAVAIAAALVVLGLGGVLIAALSGGSAPSPHYVPAGGAARQLPTPRVRLGRVATSRFTPAPSAMRAAARLPLAEQVAQLFMVDVRGPSAGPSDVGSGWGGVVITRGNVTSAPQGAALVRALGAARVPSIPALRPLIAAVQAGGSHSAFGGLPPAGQQSVAASGDPSVERREALAAGNRLRALGVEMTIAPLADVDVPSGVLTGELFGSDPAAVSAFTRAAVAGYSAAGIAAAVGHFPGEGSASSDPSQSPATVGGSLAQLESRDLLPFDAIAARAPAILMSNAAYAAFDGVTPASVNPKAIAVLRDTLHFRGVVMSGDLDAVLQPTGDTPGQAAIQGLQAGVDLLYITGSPSEPQAAYAGLLAAARRSAALRSLVHSALLEDLTLKARYGLL